MKIERVRTLAIRRNYDGSARNTRHGWPGKNYVLVSVETDDGLSGLGEMYCDGHGSPAVAEAMIRDEVAPVLVGEDPSRIAWLRARLADLTSLSGRADGFGPAFSAIDIALWDLMGKRAGMPLWRLLGGHENRVSVYGSGGMYGPTITPATLAAGMGAAVARGLAGIKIKGAGASLAEDVARVAAVREAIGPGERLMVDAMFAPSVPEAVAMARALAPFGLHFLEAPTNARDIRGWQAVATAGGIPLAGPELEPGMDLMRDHLTAGAVHFLQFDVVLAGGISTGRDLAALARGFHRPVTLHCAASAVGLAASAHLGASMPNCDSLEYHLMHQGLHDRLWTAGWTMADGALTIPDLPGLGLGFDLDTLIAAEGIAAEGAA